MERTHFQAAEKEGGTKPILQPPAGLFNLAVGYLLVCRVGSFNLRKNQHVLVLGVGILLESLFLAHTFGRFHGGL